MVICPKMRASIANVINLMELIEIYTVSELLTFAPKDLSGSPKGWLSPKAKVLNSQKQAFRLSNNSFDSRNASIC